LPVEVILVKSSPEAFSPAENVMVETFVEASDG
jgi:hypothetical protein